MAMSAVFRLLRAGEQILFFGLRTKSPVAFFAAFPLGALLYAYPWYAAARQG